MVLSDDPIDNPEILRFFIDQLNRLMEAHQPIAEFRT